MSNFLAKHLIEALRSGISSKEVGARFNKARIENINTITNEIDKVAITNKSSGSIIAARYGEGKTHFLNSIIKYASDNNFIVSQISLGKETPFSNLPVIYSKIARNTYFPNKLQSGFLSLLESLNVNDPIYNNLLDFSHSLKTDKFYYLLKILVRETDPQEKQKILKDFEGDFISTSELKKAYKNNYGKAINLEKKFSKSQHISDYFSFLSYLFSISKYRGWVILFDEAELLGGFGKNTRLKSYLNISTFLNIQAKFPLISTYSLFAFNSSYVNDVITKKHEYENVARTVFELEDQNTIEKVLNEINHALVLKPLTNNEIADIIKDLINIHQEAYNYNGNYDVDFLLKISEKAGNLLRNRIRGIIEMLDQYYQYGDFEDIETYSLN
jgi:hypothetical protein